MPKLGCLVMAAGNAERFGENKLAARFDGKTLIERALDAIPEGLFDVVTVVTQYPQIAEAAKLRGFDVIRNEHPDWGISYTIRLGTEAMKDCSAILYMVSDQPLLQRETLKRLVSVWKGHPDCIVGASHGGKRGNPNIFPSRFFGELLSLREDCGGNTVIRRHEDALLLVETDALELTDCDTPQALRQLETENAET